MTYAIPEPLREQVSRGSVLINNTHVYAHAHVCHVHAHACHVLLMSTLNAGKIQAGLVIQGGSWVYPFNI